MPSSIRSSGEREKILPFDDQKRQKNKFDENNLVKKRNNKEILQEEENRKIEKN